MMKTTTIFFLFVLFFLVPQSGFAKKKAEEGATETPKTVKWDQFLEFEGTINEGSWDQLWPIEWKLVLGLEAEYLKVLRLKGSLKGTKDPLQVDGKPLVTVDDVTVRYKAFDFLTFKGGWDKTPALGGLDLGLGGRDGYLVRKTKDAGFGLDRFFLETTFEGGTKDSGFSLSTGEYFDYGQYAPLTLMTLVGTWSKGNNFVARWSYYPTVIQLPGGKVIVDRGLVGAGMELDWGAGGFSLEGNIFGSSPSIANPVSYMNWGVQSTLRFDLLKDPVSTSVFGKTSVVKVDQEDTQRFEFLGGLMVKGPEIWDMTIEGGSRSIGGVVQGLFGLEFRFKF